jgi:hypothetical protein
MNRKDVERVFSSAIKKEHFSYHSLYSYYLDKGWVGFYLQFDHENKLRRIYVQHKKIQRSTGVEIGLCSANILLPS